MTGCQKRAKILGFISGSLLERVAKRGRSRGKADRQKGSGMTSPMLMQIMHFSFSSCQKLLDLKCCFNRSVRKLTPADQGSLAFNQKHLLGPLFWVKSE
jgi:hypothetical protein